MVYLVPGTGFVEARAAGGFMPGFGRQVGGAQVTPSRDGPVAAEPKTPATAGSPPVTPASQIIPSFSNMSLEEAETKEDDKKTLNYLLRAPTLRLDDTHVDPTQKDNDTEAATQKDMADVQSVNSTPYQPDNQLGLSDAESPWPKDSECPEPPPDKTKISVPPSLSLAASPSVAASPAASPSSSAADSSMGDGATQLQSQGSGGETQLQSQGNGGGTQLQSQGSGGGTQLQSQGSGGGSAKKNKYSDGTYWKLLESI